ncbi:MAG: hypothetical protein V7765_21975, partial [Oleispira sp.]
LEIIKKLRLIGHCKSLQFINRRSLSGNEGVTTITIQDLAASAIQEITSLVEQNAALRAALEALMGRAEKNASFPCGYLDDAYKALVGCGGEPSYIVLDDLIEEFERRNELPKCSDEYIVNDDTQVGIEFAFDKLLGTTKDHSK